MVRGSRFLPLHCVYAGICPRYETLRRVRWLDVPVEPATGTCRREDELYRLRRQHLCERVGSLEQRVQRISCAPIVDCLENKIKYRHLEQYEAISLQRIRTPGFSGEAGTLAACATM